MVAIEVSPVYEILTSLSEMSFCRKAFPDPLDFSGGLGEGYERKQE
jgi:hypothetical protein